MRVVSVTTTVWKTIKVGTGLKTANDFGNALRLVGARISKWVSDALKMPAFKVSETRVEVELVVKSVMELGFAEGAPWTKVYTKAFELGLELCPAEVGPQLRRQYLDQPRDEVLIVAMEPITDSRSRLLLFCVVHHVDGLWLRSITVRPGSSLRADHLLVFLRRENKK